MAAIGRLKKGPERELAQRYHERAQKTGRLTGISAIDILEFAESRCDDAAKRRDDEAHCLLSNMPQKAHIIAFDERGKTPSSREFAAIIRSNLDNSGPDIGMLIGGPDGLAPWLREQANDVFSFGRLTLPHQLVRVVVFEQIYRATTILTGHPYHRD